MPKTMKMTKLARQALDERLAGWRSFTPSPVRGWIRAIRESLGMSAADLAARLGTTRQAVAQLERSEADGSIRLESLRRAAEALDCTLVYALVPSDSLEEIVDRRAHDVALQEAERVRHTMLLEDQLVDESLDKERHVDELAEELKNSRRLWRA
jgi:predicted DNA-binding mobile mystery protein A